MRISLNWLRELVEPALTLTPEELAEILTLAGFEVEDIEDRLSWAFGVVVGRVLECLPHPNADKLSVTTVDIGSQSSPLQIVCGAANIRADIYVPVATVGTYLPKIDLKIRPAKLRGVRSEGMICSLAEVGLAKESAGIHIFAEVDQENPDLLAVGSDARPLLGLDDVILDLTATANRADALSMVGVAREVAALTGVTVKLPAVAKVEKPTAASHLQLKISATQANPTYIGTVISQVKVAASPHWLQQRLQAAGVRPINNVVDITNYILLEWGQPLHAFDRDRLQLVARANSLGMGVRFAEAGESLRTLDGQNRSLSPQNLLITANDKPVAIAGVMGGQETEVHAGTENLVLEAALFDSATIRRSARSLGLRSEASARYERGVNSVELERACDRALNLLQEITGAVIEQQVMVDTRPNLETFSRSIELRLDRVNQLLGPIDLGETTGELQEEQMQQILTALGCEIKPHPNAARIWSVKVPPYRHRDLEREIDLIEEIGRVYGYDRFCDTLPEKTEPGDLGLEVQLRREIRAAFRATGLTELIHYSLVKPGEDRQIVLANPLFAEYSALRTDLVSGLIEAFEYNRSQGNPPLNGFEIGRIFWQDEEGLAEAEALAGILGGDPSSGKWTRGGKNCPINWFEAKGVLESVFQRLGLIVEYQPNHQDSRLHPGRTASLWLQGNRLGTFGQLHPGLRKQRDLPDEVYAFELYLDVLVDCIDAAEIAKHQFQSYSTYPATDRDIAFFASTQISVAELLKAISLAGKEILESVELFDQYRGENVPPGQRSLAFRLVYRAGDRTLTDSEVETVHQKVRASLIEKFHVNLRS
ncbi:phenylalanine--tRNA ligase subunit beta [Synechocystis sp. PCC 7509]|uniref:phenylalanine--tRNA ligase subunit beta n=1 Tax=Synechocystis sp. PCC 7509 TaxID=927677 RepID=UPI0002ABFCCE|nr:phenylalanine--tRNA ligase subunit beta [Synechocystis sp. PCC 7509]